MMRYAANGRFLLACTILVGLIAASCGCSGDSTEADAGCPQPEEYQRVCIPAGDGTSCNYIHSFCKEGEWTCREGGVHPPAPPEFEDWAWRCGYYRCYAQDIPAEPGEDWQEAGEYTPPDPEQLTGEWTLVADSDAIVAEGCERQPFQFAEGDSLAVDPTNPDVMYAGFGVEETRGSFWVTGVFKSVDGGRSWFEARARLGLEGCWPDPWVEACSYGTTVVDLYIDPEDTQQVFASTDERGLYRTRDGGRHWEHVRTVCDGYGYAGPVIRTPAGSYFAACYNMLYRSRDGGQSWPWLEQVSRLEPARWITALAVDPSRPQRLWVGVGGGLHGRPGEGFLYRSDDEGESFTELGLEIDDSCEGQGLAAAIAICDADPDQMAVAVLYCGLFLSDDGGQSWHRAAEPMHLGIVVEAQYAPVPDRCELLVAIDVEDDGGTWSTNDGGRTWQLEIETMLSDLSFNPYLPQVLMGINIWDGFDEDAFELWMRH